MILTDGEIHDMKDTRDLICQAAHLPASVIIVGIGNEKFEMMQALDGDTEPLCDRNGNKCARDIVQFVKFKECMKQGNLAEQVLKEVPEQVCKFMEKVSFVPQPVQVNQAIYEVQAAATPAEQMIQH